MKKEYSTPIVEKIAFNYRDQVVAASSIETDLESNGSGGQRTEGRGSLVCGIANLISEGVQIQEGCWWD